MSETRRYAVLAADETNAGIVRPLRGLRCTLKANIKLQRNIRLEWPSYAIGTNHGSMEFPLREMASY
jgi:hypothetical protein